MGLLDVQIPQLLSSQSGVADNSGLMRSTISEAESGAQAAQAFFNGDASSAFQTAHMRFVEAAQKCNQLLDMAQGNMGESASTYVAQDSSLASDIAGTVTSV